MRSFILGMLVIVLSGNVAFSDEGTTSKEQLRDKLNKAKYDLARMQEATERWKNLSSVLKDGTKSWDNSSFIEKDVRVQGLLIRSKPNGLLKIRCDEEITCTIYPPRDWKLPIADTMIMEVVGKVIGVKPESKEVSIKAASIYVESE